MNKSSSGGATLVFFAVMFVGCGTGCIPSDDPSAGGRAKRPQPRPSTSAMLPDVGEAVNSWLADDDFSALDQAIVEDCNLRFSGGFWQSNSRVWSQNVPDRDCTTDSECGDGFCDRGHCGAIWSCETRYGQRCINGIAAPSPGGGENQICEGICLDGRCRSCIADEECIKQRGPDFICAPRSHSTWGRRCSGNVGPVDLNRPLPDPPPHR